MQSSHKSIFKKESLTRLQTFGCLAPSAQTVNPSQRE